MLHNNNKIVNMKNNMTYFEVANMLHSYSRLYPVGVEMLIARYVGRVNQVELSVFASDSDDGFIFINVHAHRRARLVTSILKRLFVTDDIKLISVESFNDTMFIVINNIIDISGLPAPILGLKPKRRHQVQHQLSSLVTIPEDSYISISSAPRRCNS